MKIILSADSTCDISAEIQKKYDVHMYHYHIQLGNETYVDKVEISPKEIFAAWREKGILPKTAAITPIEYSEYFKQWVSDGYEVIHINLGSELSSAHQNCVIAAEELGHVYPVDSASLSTGSGLLVVKAGEMIAQGMEAGAIVQELNRLKEKLQVSFVLDTLEFLKAGGRCSSLAAIGANLLNLKPCIEVNNKSGGKMTAGKKYRGSIESVLPKYIKDKLINPETIDADTVFITFAETPESDLLLVEEEIKKIISFQNVYRTIASGTISAHCGPRTLGIIFMRK